MAEKLVCRTKFTRQLGENSSVRSGRGSFQAMHRRTGFFLPFLPPHYSVSGEHTIRYRVPACFRDGTHKFVSFCTRCRINWSVYPFSRCIYLLILKDKQFFYTNTISFAYFTNNIKSSSIVSRDRLFTEKFPQTIFRNRDIDL